MSKPTNAPRYAAEWAAGTPTVTHTCDTCRQPVQVAGVTTKDGAAAAAAHVHQH